MPLTNAPPEPDYNRLADAIYQAEGGPKAKVPYGILSVKVKDAEEARKVAINTARNNYRRWMEAGAPGKYIDFLADRYVPPSADPKGNVNWKSNVARIYAASTPTNQPPPVVTNAPVQSIFMEPLPKYPPLR